MFIILTLSSMLLCSFSGEESKGSASGMFEFSVRHILDNINKIIIQFKKIFFLYKTCAGSKLFPCGPNITAVVILFFTS